MKIQYALSSIALVLYGLSAFGQNTFPTTGNAGINTTIPSFPLHIKGTSTTPGWIALEKYTTGETGLQFLKSGSPVFYFWSDDGTDALKIKANNQAGETDAAPRLEFPYSSKNIHMALSGGNVGVGSNNPLARLHVSGGDVLLQNPSTGYPILWLKDVAGTNTIRIDYNSIIGAGGNLTLRSPAAQNILLNDVGGNVGIGVAAPSSKLHIADGTGGDQLRISRGTGAVRFGQDLNQDNLYLWNSNVTKTYMFWKSDGSVGIGTANPDAKLTVKGNIHAEEVKVDLSVPGPDYVFEPTYHLPSLQSIKTYIDQNKHLPEVPSAKEMEANGVNLGEMNMLLLKKVEELTLHLINQQKEIEQLKKKVENR